MLVDMGANPGFRDLQNYTTLKRLRLSDNIGYGFRDLQNYTTLKPLVHMIHIFIGFRDLQNYTTLKHSTGKP